MIRENQRFLNHLNIVTDLVLLFFSMLAAYWIRFSIFDGRTIFNLNQYLQIVLVLAPVTLITYGLFGLYDSFRTEGFRSEFSKIFRANVSLAVICIVLLYAVKIIDVSRWLLAVFFCTNILLLTLKRYLMRRILVSMRSHGYNTKSVVIIGAGETARKYLKAIQAHRTYGFRYEGYVADTPENAMQGEQLGGYKDLYRVLTEHMADEAICAIDMQDADRLEDIVSACEATGTKISIIPFCYRYIPSRPAIDQLDGIPLINLRQIPLDNLGNAFLKRMVDIFGSLLLLILTSPMMLVTAIGVRLSSPGPVIFRQKRVGLNKKNFTMYKFRSMRVNAASDTAWSTQEDDRRTKFGSFIRRYSIDEFPQFFNVLKGDMSLVGPRPEMPYYVDNFKDEIPLYMVKHQVKPGVTGLAQVNGFRGDTSIRRRVEYDIEYIENWSLLLDFSILLRTVFHGFKNDEKRKV